MAPWYNKVKTSLNICRRHKLYEIEQQINEHVSSIKSLLAQTSHTPSEVSQHFKQGLFLLDNGV